jgi:hypothetical protein
MTTALNTDPSPAAPPAAESLRGLTTQLEPAQRTLWVLGGSDLEMKAIKALLTLCGQPIRDFNTGWGVHEYSPTDLGLARSTDDDAQREKLSTYRTICFVECRPKTPGEECWENVATEEIDHHGSRASEPASIMQVLRKLESMGVTVSAPTRRYVELVALNDTGHIDAMRWLGASPEEMSAIRALDRKAQGVTSAQEQQAEAAIREKTVEGRLTIVRLPHSKCSPVTDRLHGTYDQLLILSKDGETNFYGDGEVCQELAKKFPGSWSGGSGLGRKGDSAYWGSSSAQQEDVFEEVRRQLGART